MPESVPSAAAVDPRDDAISTEVAYRMQAEWTGEDMHRVAITAAMLAREAVADEIEKQLHWNAVEGNKVAPVVNETVRRAAQIARTGRWSLDGR